MPGGPGAAAARPLVDLARDPGAIVAKVKTRDPDPSTVPAERAETSDDPFAGAPLRPPGGPAEGERSATIVGPLAKRDPHAEVEVEDSAEFDVTGAASFDDLLRHVRWRGFLAGAAVGALVVGAGAIALSWALSRPPPPAGVPLQIPLQEPGRAGGEPRPNAPPRQTPEGRPPAPGPAAAVRDQTRPARATGKGRLRPGAGEEPRGVAAPGLVLGPADEPSGPGAGPVATRAPPRRLDPAAVAAALAGRREEIEACATAHPADTARAGGRRFHLLLTIDRTGQVAAQVDDAEIGATALGACLVRVAGEDRFAPFDGDPVRADLPLRFSGGG